MVPLFSVIIPTYNRADLLCIAVESVQRQSFEDWELIIIDDGSTDSTREHVKSFQDKRIRYVYQTQQGRSRARNSGIEHSTGKFICFLDSDDVTLPDK